MAHRKQGYNARLDESLGSRNRGRKTQSLKSRRDESKGTEKAMGKRAFSAVGTMDKGSRRKSSKRVVNLGAGGRVGGTKASRNSDLTSQHKRLAMGERVPQGKSPVRMRGGGRMGPANRQTRRPPNQAALAARAAASTRPKPPMPSGGWGSGLPLGRVPGGKRGGTVRMRGGGGAGRRGG